MKILLKELLNEKINFADDRQLPIHDLFIDGRWLVRYVAADPDSEFEQPPMLISTSVLSIENDGHPNLHCLAGWDKICAGYDPLWSILKASQSIVENRTSELHVVNRFGWPIYWLGTPPVEVNPASLFRLRDTGPLWSLRSLLGAETRNRPQPLILRGMELSLRNWEVTRLDLERQEGDEQNGTNSKSMITLSELYREQSRVDSTSQHDASSQLPGSQISKSDHAQRRTDGTTESNAASVSVQRWFHFDQPDRFTPS